MQQLHSLKDQNIIKVISGVRRCGKSTLLMMFADELIRNGIQKEQIQFYNFEDLDTLALGDIYQIHTHIKNLLVEDKPNYIFLDEVQNIKEFQRLVDSLYIKPNVDIYITGSNAYMLSGELATLLTGRYVEINLLPLQFTEYNDFIHAKSPKLSNNETWANFIHYDGVPKYTKQLHRSGTGDSPKYSLNLKDSCSSVNFQLSIHKGFHLVVTPHKKACFRHIKQASRWLRPPWGLFYRHCITTTCNNK
jgi:hypothetical protein